jgi:methylenetetrahydrofolate dehydrogenase (NADP+)/methenyltetrahydrofolate cyclohydrolase
MVGKPLKEAMWAEAAARVEGILKSHGKRPCLAVILVGDDPPSATYVKNKHAACRKVGIDTRDFHLPAETSQADLTALVRGLNDEQDVNGILVQLPLPERLDERAVINRVSPMKDVDCLHPENVGLLYLGTPRFEPCTPAGIMRLLAFYGFSVEGKRVVIIGRSNIVGKPLSALMLKAHATVTLCHSRTRDLPGVAREAEILVAAVGKPHVVTADFVRDGAVVVDVGISHALDPSAKTGVRLVGDVDFDAVLPKVAAISPVPGGVGPLTIASLLMNTLRAFELQAG